MQILTPTHTNTKVAQELHLVFYWILSETKDINPEDLEIIPIQLSEHFTPIR